MNALALLDELNGIERDRQQAHSAGLPALQRLADVAQGDSGQARIVGLFLLGLYNGADYPFDLTQLRGLDLALFQDCQAVLHLDYHPEREVHEYLVQGDALFSRLRATLLGAGGDQ